jgi:enoyl-CoA hydratase
MSEPAVLTDERDGILLVTLNRPDQRNAIDAAVAQGIAAAVERLDAAPELRVGILTGAGKGFCAGMDLKAFASVGPPKSVARFLQHGAEKPLIAAVEGFAVAGGLELALTCDLLVAAKGAKLGIPEVGVGLFAAGGALLRLPQRVPYGVALELALTAELITAEQGHAYGLVTRLAEPGQAVDEARGLAERIARNAPLAVATSKRLIRAAQGCTEEEFWSMQKPLLPGVFESDDAREGPRAFAEKRAPVWSGR